MSERAVDIGAARPLPATELELQFSRSGGPGGQHVNTSSTRVEVVWDLAASPTLSEPERRRLMAALANRLDGAGRLRVVAQDERSQLRNRELAIDRLAELVRAALKPPPPRRPTRPSRASRSERLDAKRRSGETKRLRRPPGDEP